jgi:hypothetical protein
VLMALIGASRAAVSLWAPRTRSPSKSASFRTSWLRPGRALCTPPIPISSETHPWPRYDGDSPVYLSESVSRLTTLRDSDFSAAHECAFWDRILIY